jgi:hypothetical protein
VALLATKGHWINKGWYAETVRKAMLSSAEHEVYLFFSKIFELFCNIFLAASVIS